MQIRNNILTITCNDLYIIKERFYTKCNEYKGNTDNLTGLTELLVAMFLKAFKDELNLQYNIESDVPKSDIIIEKIKLIMPFYHQIITSSMGFQLKEETIQLL